MMLKRLLALVTFIALLPAVLGAYAQDDPPPYRLRVPSAEAFIAGMPSSLVLIEREDPGSWAYPTHDVNYPLVRLLLGEFEYRYDDTVDAELLYEFYDSLDVFVEPYMSPTVTSALPSSLWNLDVFVHWLRDNPINLDQVDRLEFAGYVIDVEGYDLNADGENEWLLFVDRTGQHSRYEYLWTAIRNPESSTGYTIGWPALTDYISAAHHYSEHNARKQILYFEDLNADEKPELVILAYGQALPMFPNIGYVNRFYVLGWREYGLRVLTVREQDGETWMTVPRNSVAAYRVDCRFRNLDDDPALEISCVDGQNTNLGCGRWERTTFDWDGTNYVLIEYDDGYSETISCALRQAEEAAWYSNEETDWEWAHDYDTAIEFYRLAWAHYEALQEQGPYFASYLEAQLAHYARERLVLAYAITGRIDEAEALLDEIRAEPRDETAPRSIETVLLEESRDGIVAYRLCKAAHDYLVEDYLEDWEDGYYRDIPGVGHIISDLRVPSDPYPPPDPASGGCDVSGMIDRIVSDHTFDTGQSPVAQLSALGVDVTVSMADDLDNDGQNEWLVWLGVSHNPVLFVPAGDHYRVSRLELGFFLAADGAVYWPRYPFDDFMLMGADSQMATLPLPGNAGAAWAALIALSEDEHSGLGYRCAVSGEDAVGAPARLDIWQLQAGELVKTLEVPLCELRTLDELFSASGELHAWAVSPVEDDAPRLSVPATYTWDAQQMAYVSPFAEAWAMLTPTPTPTATPEPTPVPGEPVVEQMTPGRAHYKVIESLSSGEGFEEALAALDAVLASEVTINFPYDPSRSNLLYCRALVLEAMGQEDEAIAAYVRVRDEAPEEQWQTMAALHLEPVEDGNQ